MSDSIDLFDSAPKRIEEKTGVLFDELLNRYFWKMPNANNEAKTWLHSIRDKSEEVGLCYLNEMLLVAFAAGYTHREAQPFACNPKDVIENAINPKMIPVMSP